MNERPINILIIGGDSFLGSNFSNHLARKNISRIATSRKRYYKYLKNRKFFKLEKWQKYNLEDNFTHAVIFVGISGYEKCQKNPKSWDTNVRFTTELISGLMSRGINVTVISSSAVFSSTTENADEFTTMNPDSEYGRQKSEMEKLSTATAIAHEHASLTIVRPTKVMSGKSETFINWERSVAKNQEIVVFDDLFVSPISIQYFCNSLAFIMLSNRPGIYHLSGEQSVSYASLALEYASKLKVGFNNFSNLKSGEKIFYKHATGKLAMKNTVNSFQIHPQTISDFLTDVLS
jgi:dTDP-4-dehydrorhamnose reductase